MVLLFSVLFSATVKGLKELLGDRSAAANAAAQAQRKDGTVPDDAPGPAPVSSPADMVPPPLVAGTTPSARILTRPAFPARGGLSRGRGILAASRCYLPPVSKSAPAVATSSRGRGRRRSDVSTDSFQT